MKRSGFVSNSNSSAFVTLVTKEAHEKAMEQLSGYYKATIKVLSYQEDVFGQEYIAFSDINTRDYSGWEDVEVDFDPQNEEEEMQMSDGVWEAYYEYEKLVSKEDKWTWKVDA